MAINRLFPADDSSGNEITTAQLRSAGQIAVPFPPQMIPYGVMPGQMQWQQAVLQMAYQLARLIVAPPRHETLFTSSLN